MTYLVNLTYKRPRSSLANRHCDSQKTTVLNNIELAKPIKSKPISTLVQQKTRIAAVKPAARKAGFDPV